MPESIAGGAAGLARFEERRLLERRRPLEQRGLLEQRGVLEQRGILEQREKLRGREVDINNSCNAQANGDGISVLAARFGECAD